MTSQPVCGYPGWAERYAGPSRDVCRRVLVELARADPRVVCLDSDVGGLEDLFAELPEQYVNVGIAEANLIGMAAGMAAAGLRPFAHTLSSFAATRACEQIKVDVAGNGLPVRIVVTHGGLSAGHYGPTHHAVEDIAIMRTMPGMTVLVPADASEAEQALRAAADLPGPVFLRLGRAATPLVYQEPYRFQVGVAMPFTFIQDGPRASSRPGGARCSARRWRGCHHCRRVAVPRADVAAGSRAAGSRGGAGSGTRHAHHQAAGHRGTTARGAGDRRHRHR